MLFDNVRGGTNPPGLYSNLSNAQFAGDANNFVSFDTDGFTIGQDSYTNGSGNNLVAWNWKANSIPTINTDGTIQSVVSANQASGFSIISYTGNNVAGSTIGHGLSAAPEMVIIKQLDITELWVVGSDFLNGGTSPWDYVLHLNNTNAESNQSWPWNDTAPSSSVITIGNGGGINTNGGTFITYAFHSIAGFSKIGSYVGNATSNRAITGLGFAPSWVMIKNASESAKNWAIWDSARGGALTLFPNTDGAEANEPGVFVSLDSDGFTVNQEATANGNGSTIIYMAFKENPVQYAIPSGEMGYLVAAGGGGSGADSGGGPGGGAGGLRTTYGLTSGGGASAETNLTLATGTYTITVGAGGAAYDGSTTAQNGVASTITGVASVSTVGGGAGGDFLKSGTAYKGNAGGSGGGSANSNGALTLAEELVQQTKGLPVVVDFLQKW